MSIKQERLYADLNYVILYEQPGQIITYSSSRGTNPARIHLPSELLYIQLYPSTGDLIIACADGTRRIFMARDKALITCKLAPEAKIHLIGKGFLIDESEPLPRVWQVKTKRLQEMKHSLSFINPDNLSPNCFLFYTGSQNEKIIRTASGTVKLVKPEFKLINYEPEEPEQAPPEPEAEEAQPAILEEAEQAPQSPEAEDEEAQPDIVAVNPSGTFQVHYQTNSSLLKIFSKSVNGLDMLYQEDRHTCAVSKVIFLNDQFFASLDTGGKLKIWRADARNIQVCQTLNPEDFHPRSYYTDLNYDHQALRLQLRENNRTDTYIVRLDKYKRGKKCDLLHYESTFEHEAAEHAESGISGLNQKTKRRTSRQTAPEPEIESFILPESMKETITASEEEKREAPKPVEASTSNSEGDRTPAPRFRRTGAKIYVGIDLGTSRTKVSFNNESEGRYQPLVFKSLHPKGFSPESRFDDYVIPSVAARNGDKLSYGFEALKPGGEIIQNFKQHLLQEDLSKRYKLICAGYLAFVMQAAKENICQLVRAGEQAEYIFSVCLPVEQLNNDRQAQMFGQTLLLARRIFAQGCHHDWNAMMKLLLETSGTFDDGSTKTSIIPESIAEILDFCERSARSKLYALYDFGAGTTDLTLFFVNTQKGTTDIIDAKIVYKGYSYLDKLASETEVTPDVVRKYYKSIWEEFHESGIWERVKDKLRGMETMKFFYDITVFGSGGGFNDPTVREVFSTIPLYHERTNEYIGVKEGIQALAEPVDWSGDMPPYTRFAVSFGLTKKPEETLGRYVMPKDCAIRDFTPDTRISTIPDELIPTREWLGR